MDMEFNVAFKNIPSRGWLTREEAKLLWDEASSIKGAILEVGSYYGRSTVLLGNLGNLIYVVDPLPNDKIYEVFKKNIEGYINISFFRQKIEEWEPRKISFAYLDGDHSYEGTINQIEIALKCGAEKIAIHDVNDDGEGLIVKAVALKYFGKWSKRVERLAIFENGTKYS